MKLPKDLDRILLAVYLILAGLSAFGFAFPFIGLITGLCALAAGILMLVNR